ncbi:hypothetical protein LPJ73_002525 [Coemansia sp. RSA 2703]|nr:hypothetical protein LPJ73_002525 [Coemansia sp. RSA 2703]
MAIDPGSTAGPENTIIGGHVQSQPQQHQPSSTNSRSQLACRFFRQESGCRNGDACRFQHIPAPTPPTKPAANQKPKPKPKPKYKPRANAKQNPSTLQRKSEIDSLLRAPRWTVKRLASDRGETAFAVEMPPSDPDFPYDVSRLYFAYIVPLLYPPHRTSDPLPTIQIANKNIPLGVKRNIEVAFTKHVRASLTLAVEQESLDQMPSLVEYVEWLDQSLERLMQMKPAPTIKFSSFGPSAAKPATAAPAAQTMPSNASSRPESRVSAASSVAASVTPPSSRPAVARPQPRLPASQPSGAEESSRRLFELSQLERRFRSSYKVLANSDPTDTLVSIDIAPTDPDIQPLDITQFTAVISVSPEYPNRPLTLSIDPELVLGRKGKPSSWRPVEGRQPYIDHVCAQFAARAAQFPETSILHHLNWLDRQLVTLFSTPPPPPSTQNPSVPEKNTLQNTPTPSKPGIFDSTDPEKPWIKTITRAEAGLPDAVASMTLADSDHQADTASESEDNGSASDGSHHEDESPSVFSKPLRRGTEIRFGRITMNNISLLHCHSLNLTVRCARCKGMVELKGIAPTLQTAKDCQLWKACDACASIMGIRFRPDWIFPGSTTLGFLDCSSCAPVDLLPSKYTLSCESCIMKDDGEDEDNNGDGRNATDTVANVGVGAIANINCKTCYSRMTVEIAEPQFVQLQSGLELGGTTSSASMISREVERTRKTKVNKREELARLGVVPGQPLPNNGACKHFGRSKRWLRFPCCGKTYPCVSCHDDKEDHDYEYAQIMICGFCAKEQRISRAQQTGNCSACGAQVIKKIDGNRAFWQGGTGVRDRTKMSRKDSKKFQGLGKTVAAKKVTTPKKH